MARTFQVTKLLPDYTVEENVALALQVAEGAAFEMLSPARGDAAIWREARRQLDEAGLGDRAQTLATELSHGEAKQLELVIALCLQPRLLLLDEPMAGLGPNEAPAMVRRLAAMRGQLGIMLVEHDMDAVFSLAMMRP